MGVNSPVNLSALAANVAARAGARPRDVHWGDRTFRLALAGAAVMLVSLLLGIGTFLTHGAMPSLSRFGVRFLSYSHWDPITGEFGALPVIYGTLVSSILSVIIATPVSIGIALFLNEVVPRRVAEVTGSLVEILAAIPSVVYGLWGIFVLAPLLREYVEPALGESLGFLPLFQGAPYGVGMLAAAIILAIMITPTIAAICREIFQTIPSLHREAALALGATRWETIRIAVLRSSVPGIFGAIMLGLGRSLGETMAVTMVIGNRAEISASLFAPGQTMASVIANEYAEATSDLHLAALVEVGLVLFLVTLIVNGLARLIVAKARGGSRRG